MVWRHALRATFSDALKEVLEGLNAEIVLQWVARTRRSSPLPPRFAEEIKIYSKRVRRAHRVPTIQVCAYKCVSIYFGQFRRPCPKHPTPMPVPMGSTHHTHNTKPFLCTFAVSGRGRCDNESFHGHGWATYYKGAYNILTGCCALTYQVTSAELYQVIPNLGRICVSKSTFGLCS